VLAFVMGGWGQRQGGGGTVVNDRGSESSGNSGAGKGSGLAWFSEHSGLFRN